MSNVIPLNLNLTPDTRAFVAMQKIIDGLDELTELSRIDREAVQFYDMPLDQAGTDITLLRARVNMGRSTAALCGKFERAP